MGVICVFSLYFKLPKLLYLIVVLLIFLPPTTVVSVFCCKILLFPDHFRSLAQTFFFCLSFLSLIYKEDGSTNFTALTNLKLKHFPLASAFYCSLKEMVSPIQSSFISLQEFSLMFYSMGFSILNRCSISQPNICILFLWDAIGTLFFSSPQSPPSSQIDGKCIMAGLIKEMRDESKAKKTAHRKINCI